MMDFRVSMREGERGEDDHGEDAGCSVRGFRDVSASASHGAVGRPQTRAAAADQSCLGAGYLTALSQCKMGRLRGENPQTVWSAGN